MNDRCSTQELKARRAAVKLDILHEIEKMEADLKVSCDARHCPHNQIIGFSRICNTCGFYNDHKKAVVAVNRKLNMLYIPGSKKGKVE